MQKEEEEEEENKEGGLGELGRRKRQQRRIAQRLLYKDNKRRNRPKKGMAAKDTDRRDRRDIERGGSGRRGGVCHCFRVWFECVALLGFSILIRTMY
jgi:hypothetical protein